jgi:hypothetical protein
MVTEGLCFLLVIWVGIKLIAAWQSLLLEKEKFEIMAAETHKKNMYLVALDKKRYEEEKRKAQTHGKERIENNEDGEFEIEYENDFELVDFHAEEGTIEFVNKKFK